MLLSKLPRFGVYLLASLVLNLTGVMGVGALTPDQAIATSEIVDLVWSPDGRQLALTVAGPPEKEGTPRHIWLYTSASGEFRQLTWSPKSERSPRWSPDGRQLAFLSDRDGQERIYLMPTTGGEARLLTTDPHPVTKLQWSPDGKTIAFLAPRAKTAEEKSREERREDARVFEVDDRFPLVWIVDLATGEVKQKLEAPWRANDLVWSPRGDRLYVAVTEDESAPRLVYRVLAIDPAGEREPETISTIEGPIADLRLAPDGAWLSYLGCRERGPSPHDLFLIPSAGGEPRNLSAKSIDNTIESHVWQRNGKLLVSVMVGFRSHLIEIGLDEKTRLRLEPELTAHTLAVSADGQLALAAENVSRPPELWLADNRGEKGATGLRRISDFHPALAAMRLGRPTVFTYKSFDGMSIEAMLLDPPASDPGSKLPLVVIPHGGPAWRFFDGWNPLAQLLATSGHRVLMPNIRGSQGKSYEFMTLARNDWGGGDFKDLMAGVDHLVARGLADPDRLAIAGWSYGGYMSAWAVTQTHRFKAAVAGAGLFNLISEFGTEIQPSYDEWYFGLPWEKPEIYMERSPLLHASKVKTPVLLLHGTEDLIDPLSQSQELYRALKYYGVTTELVIYPRGGHTLRERGHLHDRYDRSVRWLRKYLGTAESP